MKKTYQLSEKAFQLDGKMPLSQAIPLGLQHVLAMFVGNLTPLLIITGTCGIASGEFADLQLHLLQNAMQVARFLHDHPAVAKVYYPGLEDFEGYEIAKKQMHGGFGGGNGISTSWMGGLNGAWDLFDGDMFSFDLYMSATDLSAWIIETTWKNGKSTTITLRANIKSKVNDNHLYFVLENGHTIKGHYDQNGYEFWLDFDSGSIRLHSCDEFLTGLDFIGGKYAEVTP